MRTIVAIDQSTSSTKAYLYDTEGHQLEHTSREHRQHYPRPGWVEHDAEEIWQNTRAVLRELIESRAAPAEDIVCLSITNQRETFVVFDRETGRPLRPAIVWQCRRGDPICEDMVRAGHEATVRERTGLRINTYFSAPKLAWLLRSDSEVADALRDGRALFGTIDTYLVHRLTGGRTFATDPTNASRTLLYDIRRRSWDETLCKLFGVPLRALPEVRESSSIYGETTLDGQLERPVPICGVLGDSQAALFAHRCFEPGMAKVTLGTGSSVLLHTGSEVESAGEGTVATLAWVHAGEPAYCLEGIINYAGATLTWLRDQLGLIDATDSVEELAESVSNSGGVYLVPAFAGLSAPHWDEGARAAIIGMSAHTTRAHVVRAALESIAFQVRDVLEMMQEDSGRPLGTIHADGGSTRSRFLLQLIADLTGREVRVPRDADLSPLGAMYAGALGAGLLGSLDELALLPRELTTYTPGPEGSAAPGLVDEWKRAVRRVLTREGGVSG